MPSDGRYHLVGKGSDLAIEVAGPSIEACLDAAVRGLAASLTEDRPQPRRSPVEVAGETPAVLLHGLLDETILRLDADAELAVGLASAEVAAGGLAGELAVVDLDAVAVHGDPPKAATWHGLRLEEGADGWTGAVMLDL